MVFAISQGLGRGHRDRIAGVDPHRIEVFDAADNHHVIGGVTHHLQFEFLPAQQRLFDQNLGDGAGFQAAFADRPEFFRVVGDATPRAAQGEGRPDDARIGPNRLADLLGLLQRIGDARGAYGHADAGHGLFEQQPVLRHADRLQVGANQFDAKTLQGAVFRQGHGQVEGRLPPHGRQQGIGPLPLDHPGHHLRRQRLDVGAIGQVRVGHDRGRIAVDQHHLVSLRP